MALMQNPQMALTAFSKASVSPAFGFLTCRRDSLSTQVLLIQIQKFFDGDEEAIPSIVEGILKRKLSGNHEESDDELMNEIQGGNWKQTLDDHDDDDQELDPYLSDSSDSNRD